MKAFAFEDLVGRPYEGPNGCWQIARECFRRQGIDVPDIFALESKDAAKVAQGTWSADEWIRTTFGGWRRIETIEVGCAVVFRDVDGAAVHIGVMVEPNRFIHATRKVGVVMERLDRAPWVNRFVGAYAYGR